MEIARAVQIKARKQRPAATEQRGQPRKNRLPPPPGRQRYATAGASKIQRLYRQARPRAIQEIVEGEAPYCDLLVGQVTDYFRGVFGVQRPVTPDILDFVPRFENPSDVSNPFQFDLSAGEIWNRLKICHNTAPGPDGVRYAAWKKLDKVHAHLGSCVRGCETYWNPPKGMERVPDGAHLQARR